MPSAVKPLSVGELGDLKRRLVALLNSFDVGSQPQRESIWKRINRLSSKGGPIPRDIAALMTVITEWRNSAEHEARVLSTTESAAVRQAWQAIQEWEQKRKK